MRKALLAFACLQPWAIALAAAQPGPLLTPAEAVNEALVKNDRLVNQRDTTGQAELGVRLARNAFRPKLVPNVLGSFGQTDVGSQNYRLDLTQRLTTGTEMRVGVGTSTAQIPGGGLGEDDIRFYNADTTLTLSQPVLRGFGRSVTRRQLTSAELRRSDAERQHTLAEQQIAIEVVSAYYNVVAQQSFVAVAQQSLERARKLRDASAAKLDAGLVSQLDVLRAQQLVAQAEIQWFDAQSMTEDGRDRLLFLIGRTSGDPIEVVMEIPKLDDSPVDTAESIRTALANRLELRSRAEESIDAERQLSFTRNQLLPQFDVNFALTRRETAATFTQSFRLDRFQFATFFTIAMPVDRTAHQIQFQTAVLDRDRRRRDILTLERQITDEVRRGVREHDRLRRSVGAAEAGVDIGRQEADVAELRYQRGLSNNLDVVNAESNLLAAESRRIQTLADAVVARLRLRALLGVFDPRTDIDRPAPAPVAGRGGAIVPASR